MAKRKSTGARPSKLGRYAKFFSEQELAALGEAAANGGLAEEIEVLRVKLQQALASGVELPQIVAVVRALTTAVKVQHALQGTAAQNLEEALAKVLEEIGNELDGAGT
ncbi:MAG: hypothetical protein M1370_11695 [Bacteroidetes bacterium]|nr:hypothetical protein [Bacteroidota bacterium]MCL5025741.1 hypothetical protein [Chloroflexota bacterium]